MRFHSKSFSNEHHSTNKHKSIPGHRLRRLLLTLIGLLLLLLLAVRRVAQVAGVEADSTAVLGGIVEGSNGFEDLGGKVPDVGDLTL